MFRSAVVGTLAAALAACLAPAPLGADDQKLAPGTRAWAVTFPRGSVFPAGVVPGAHVDVVATCEKPIRTAVTLHGVKVLAFDVRQKGPTMMTFQLTPTQCKIMAMLQDDGAALSTKVSREPKDHK